MATCSDLMTKNPIWCVSTDSVSNAAQLMKREEVGLLPVVEEQQNKKVIGVVTDRDLVVTVIAEGRRPEATVIADVMTRNPVTCHADNEALCEESTNEDRHHDVSADGRPRRL